MKAFRYVSCFVLGGVVAIGSLWASRVSKPQTLADPKVPVAINIHRHQAFVGIAAPVAFIGDSITDAWRDYPSLWAQFGDAANFGVGYDQVQNVLWRVQQGEVDAARVVVLMIGTNNLGLGATTPEQTAGGIINLVRVIRSRPTSPQVLLLGIFPRGRSPTDPLRAKVAEVNQLLAGTTMEGVRYMDIGGIFLESDGTISDKVMPDYLHLSREGYRRWAKEIIPAIEAMRPKP